MRTATARKTFLKTIGERLVVELQGFTQQVQARLLPGTQVQLHFTYLPLSPSAQRLPSQAEESGQFVLSCWAPSEEAPLVGEDMVVIVRRCGRELKLAAYRHSDTGLQPTRFNLKLPATLASLPLLRYHVAQWLSNYNEAALHDCGVSLPRQRLAA